MKNSQIKVLTKGAMIACIYGILMLLIRFFLTATDSIIYFVFPIPIALFTYRYKAKWGAILLATLAILSFLFCDLFYALLLIVPNLLLGFIFGLLHTPKVKILIAFSIIFGVCLICDVCQTIIFSNILGIDFFADFTIIVDMLSHVFKNLDINKMKEIVYLLIPSVFIIYSLMKVVIIYIGFNMLNRRIAKTKYLLLVSINTIKPRFIYSIFYLILSLIYFIVFNINMKDNLVLMLFLGFIISLHFIISLFFIFQASMFVSLKYSLTGMGKTILIILLTVLFPLTIIYAMIVNIIGLRCIIKAG